MLAAPAVGWGLTLYLAWKIWKQGKEAPAKEKITIPIGVWVWIIGMVILGMTTIVNHLEFNQGTVRIVKSLINVFCRQWALFALFPLIGSCLKIRPQLIYRAVCILCLESLIFLVVNQVSQRIGLPGELYVSPLSKFGGGAIHYRVNLYVGGNARLVFFGPWAPAMGLTACTLFFMALAEPKQKWRWIGVIGAATMAWTTVSRTARVSLYFVPFITLFLANIARPTLLIATAIGSVVVGCFGPQLLLFAKDFKESFDRERINSNVVRDRLAAIGLYRWWNEAPIWGHALREDEGPRVVVGMPIGGHHTWVGLLYYHGVIGCLAFALPMIWSFVELVLKAQKSKAAQVSLSVLIVLMLFSNAENLNNLIHLFWPGLVLVGIALKEPFPTLDELMERSNQLAL